MKEQEIRKEFLDFFIAKGHLLIGGSSLIPKDDPSLLLINSGMAPLKSYFTGAQKPPYPRLTNVQRCVRTNDIEEVGDIHHLTFFEMLGSWSIGAYYKKEAIHLASELLMDVLKIPQEKLYVSVYSGNPEKGIPYDQESHDSWAQQGFGSNQIVPLGDEDNFWGPAGAKGPCGPCTEVFLDIGDAAGPSYEETDVFDTKNRYIEIWNAGVFMEFNQNEDGTLSKLPFKSVDTGSGIERLSMALNGYRNIYEYGPFPAVLAQLPETLPLVEQRVIADHLRTATHLIAEGVLPGKTGREYVSRRLLRRAETLCFKHGLNLPYREIVNEVIKFDSQNHNHLSHAYEKINAIIETESTAFNRVLKNGARRIEKELKNSPVISSPTAFDIVSSAGLPLEALKELVSLQGGSVNQSGYEELLQQHKVSSRNKAPKKLEKRPPQI